MTDTSHPEHTSEVQSWYSMWQSAVIRKSNKKSFHSVNTI